MGRLAGLAETTKTELKPSRLTGLATSTAEEPRDKTVSRLSVLAEADKDKRVSEIIERIIFSDTQAASQANVELQGEAADILTETFEKPEEERDLIETALLISNLFGMDINDALLTQPAIMKEIYGDAAESMAKRFRKTPFEGGFFSKIGEAYRRGDQAISSDIAVYEAVFEGRGSVDDILTARKKVQEKIQLTPIEGNLLTNLFYKSANIVPGMVKGYWDAIPEAATGMVAGGLSALALGQVPPLTLVPEEAFTVPTASVLGLKVGLASGSAMFWYKQGAGNMFAAMMEKEYDPDVSRTVAGIAALPYAVLEFLQVQQLTPGLRTTIQKSVQKTMLTVMGKASKKYATTLSLEVLEEIGQEIIQISAEDVSGILSKEGIEIDKAFLAERMARLWLTAKESTQAMALLPVPGMAIDMNTGIRSALSAKELADIRAKLKIAQNIPVRPEAEVEPGEAVEGVAPVTEAERGVGIAEEEIEAQKRAEAVAPEVTQIPAELEPLAEEARKFETVEQFTKSQRDKFIAEQGREPSSDEVLNSWFKAKQTQKIVGAGFEIAETLPKFDDISETEKAKFNKTAEGKLILYRGTPKDVKLKDVRFGDFLSPKKAKAQFFGVAKKHEIDTKDIKVLSDEEVIFAPEGKKPVLPQQLSIVELYNQAKAPAEAEVTAEAGLVEPLTTEEVEAKKTKRIISEDAYLAAKRRITDPSKLRTGLDPSDVKDMAIIGAFHFETGVRKFAEWSAKMLSDLGEFIRPQLRDIYRRIVQTEVRADREVETEILEEFKDEKWAARAITRAEKGIKLAGIEKKVPTAAELSDAELLAERRKILETPTKDRTPTEIAKLKTVEDQIIDRNIEKFPTADITDKVRKTEVKKTETEIIEHGAYRAIAEAAEDVPQLGGVFNVDSTEIADVKQRFDGQPELLKKFNLQDIGGRRWDTIADEVGIKDGLDAFMDAVELFVQSESKDAGVSEQFLDKALEGRHPDLEVLARKLELLQAGEDAATINEELRSLADQLDIPPEGIEEFLVPVTGVTEAEQRARVLKEVTKEKPKPKRKPEAEAAAIKRAQTRAFKEKRPIFVSTRRGKISVSIKEPRRGEFVKVTPAEPGQIEGKTERLKADPTNIETERVDVAREPLNRTMTPEWYEANTEKYKKSILQKSTDLAKATVKGIDKLIGATSTRIELISPEIFRRTRRHEYNVMTRTTEMTKRVEPFLKLTKKLDKKTLRQLDLAMKNGDQVKIDAVLKENNMTAEFAEVRAVLNELYDQAVEVGIDVDYRKSYIPRIVKDTKGFLEFFQGRDDWSIVRLAIEKKEQDRGRVLTETERASVVNTLLRGYTTSALSLARPGAAKERTVEIIDANVNQFYHDFRVSLNNYINTMNEKISSREFFGRQSKQIVKLRAQLSATRTRLAKLGRREGLTPKAKPETFTETIAETKERMEEIIALLKRLGADDLSDSVGQFVIDEVLADNIKPSQEKELRDLLMGIFDPKATGKLFGDFKALTYIDVLGNFLSTVTQLEELGLAFYRSPLGFVPEAVKALFNLSEINVQDIGVTSIGVEFTEADARRALSAVLAITGFEKIDRVGKQTFINTVINKMQRQAKRPSKSFNDRLQRVFGKETAQVIQDLRSGEITDNVKYLAFNQLLDIQPIALSEMPEAYNRAGNLRIFYALKTFMAKQLDFVRTEALQDMKTKENFMRGFGRLMWLSFSLALFGAGADALKDFLRGRPFDLSDSVIDTFLRRIFFSKFQFEKAIREGFGRAFLEGFVPPSKTVDAVTRDIKNFGETPVKDFNFWRSVPIVGEVYYWWFGRGREKAAQETRKEKTKREPLF